MTLAVPSPTLVTSVTRVTPGQPPWIPTLPTPCPFMAERSVDICWTDADETDCPTTDCPTTDCPTTDCPTTDWDAASAARHPDSPALAPTCFLGPPPARANQHS